MQASRDPSLRILQRRSEGRGVGAVYSRVCLHGNLVDVYSHVCFNGNLGAMYSHVCLHGNLGAVYSHVCLLGSCV